MSEQVELWGLYCDGRDAWLKYQGGLVLFTKKDDADKSLGWARNLDPTADVRRYCPPEPAEPEPKLHPLLAAIDEHIAIIEADEETMTPHEKMLDIRRLAVPLVAELAALQAQVAEMRKRLEEEADNYRTLGSGATPPHTTFTWVTQQEKKNRDLLARAL